MTKQSKPLIATNVNVQAYVDMEVLVLSGVIDAKDEFQTAQHDAETFSLRNIIAMREAFGTDTAGYLTACAYVYGTGGNNKSKGFSRGRMAEALDAHIVGNKDEKERKESLVSVEMRYRRAVAQWLADPVRFSSLKGDETLRGLYKVYLKHTKGSPSTDVARAPTIGNASPDATAPSATTTETVTTVVAALIGRYGFQKVLAEMSAILAAEKKTKTQAATLAAVAVQVAAK